MTKKWRPEQLSANAKLLQRLYVKENKSLREIASALGLSESGVYRRLLRCNIRINRNCKYGYNNQRVICIPPYSAQLAEFIGILLGDGSLSHYQVNITLGTKEKAYGDYIMTIIEKIFSLSPKRNYSKSNYQYIYFGSRKIVCWLINMGLAYNKVGSQVSVPKWCFAQNLFMTNVIRGMIDTDGSIYRLQRGVQISFTNRSVPLHKDLQYMLKYLGYSPSKLSCHKTYLTKKSDIHKYFREIGSNNPKHLERFGRFV